MHAEAKALGRKYDFRPPPAEKDKKNQIRFEFVLEMKERMVQEEARRKYRKRKQTVKPVFDIMRKCTGVTQFHLRGLEKVSPEWKLLALAYNFKRFWNLINASKRIDCHPNRLRSDFDEMKQRKRLNACPDGALKLVLRGAAWLRFLPLSGVW